MENTDGYYSMKMKISHIRGNAPIIESQRNEKDSQN